MSTRRKLPGWAWALIIVLGVPIALIVLFFLTAFIFAIVGLATGHPIKSTPVPPVSISQPAPIPSSAPSATKSPEPAPSSKASPSSASSDYIHYGLLDTSDRRAQRFLFDFHDQFPRLVGSEPDRYLLQNGTKICQEFSYKERTGQPKMTKTEIERFISLRSTFSQQPNQATPMESWKIAKLATKYICPEFKSYTKGSR